MTTPTLNRRDRRRAETVQAILDAAERQLGEVGARELSLRAVARDLGMTAQALYHYFAGRDELITALVALAHDALADAVERAYRTHPNRSSNERLLAVTQAYRDWAVAHPTRFGLAYGVPIADYTAPAGGPTTLGPRRVAAVFIEAVFGQWTPAQLEAFTLHDADDSLLRGLAASDGGTLGDLPPAPAALFLIAWGRMHGLVTLEVFGHLGWAGDTAAALFTTAMRQLVDDLDRLRGSTGDG